MNQSEARKHMTVVAAGFVHDHIKNGVFGSVSFNSEDALRMVNPDYWSSHGDDKQFGGVHEFSMKYKLVSSMSHVVLKLQMLMPEQYFDIVDAKFYWHDTSSTSGTINETPLRGFSFYEPINRRRVRTGSSMRLARRSLNGTESGSTRLKTLT